MNISTEKFNEIVGKNIKNIRKAKNMDPDQFAHNLREEI